MLNDRLILSIFNLDKGIRDWVKLPITIIIPTREKPTNKINQYTTGPYSILNYVFIDH